MNINPTRPVEELTGNNRGITRQRLGNIHVMTPILAQCRQVRPLNMRTMPVELRRGWVKCVLDTIEEYRGTYVAVMTGRF